MRAQPRIELAAYVTSVTAVSQVGGVGLAACGRAVDTARRSSLSVACQVAATEGTAGFFRGVLPRVLMLAPASALTTATFGAWITVIGLARGGA